MEYGCIGEKLGHSFSKEIHNALTDYQYELKELNKDEVAHFMTEHDFKAINVTIPYKQTVIPYLDFIADEAKEIGAVNTIVNKDGKLYGYNTDFFGMKSLIERTKIVIEDKTVAILGGGGTAKTAEAVSKSLGAKVIYKVSRSSKENFITTTPVGMYPNIYESAVEIEKFKNLSGVVDVVYNPLRSKLVSDALNKNIKAVGGLYMLVAQAAFAVEFFIDTKIKKDKIENVFNTLFKKKENVVLIGMPSSGKTQLAKHLQKSCKENFLIVICL